MITSPTSRPPPIATVDELEVCLGRTFTEQERGQAEGYLDAASGTLRRLTNQTLTFAESIEVHDGWSAPLLQLRELPVVEVTEIQADGEVLDPDTYRIDYEAGCLWRGWGWRAGRQGIAVLYSHGWEEMPAELVLVVCNMVQRAMAVPAAGDFQSESLGPYRYDRGNLAGLGAIGLTTAEASLIERYRVKRQIIQ